MATPCNQSHKTYAAISAAPETLNPKLNYMQTVDLQSFLANSHDTTLAVRAAIQEVRKIAGPVTLRLPKGDLRLSPDFAEGKFVRLANHDSGWRRIAFLLDDISDLTIDGTGTRLHFEGGIIPFEAENVRNLIIRGCSLDWDRPFHLEARVTTVDEKKGSFEFLPSPGTIWEIRGGRLAWMARPWAHNQTFSWDQRFAESLPDQRWEHELGWNVWFDPATKTIATRSGRCIFNPFNPGSGNYYHAEGLPDGMIRISGAGGKELPRPGWIMVDKGLMRRNRLYPAFHFHGSDNIRIDEVTIHHAGGMGVIAEFCRDVILHKLTVCPSVGRIVSTTADATHFVSCGGRIELVQCAFRQMLDDGLNIHGVYGRVTAMPGNDTILLTLHHPQQAWFPFAQVGDELALVSRTDLQVQGTFSIAEVEPLNEGAMLIRSKEKLDSSVRKGGPWVLENLSWQPSFEMRNSVVCNNRARAVLFSSRAPGRIVDNKFTGNSMSGILLEGDATLWHESGPVSDLLIARNLIDGWGHEFEDGYGIALLPKIPYKTGREPYHRGVILEDNHLSSAYGNPFHTHPNCEVGGSDLANL